MQVYIMRHGDAALHAASDAERPLTQKGIDESIFMAEWLKNQGIEIDTVLVSPYLRALQTQQTVSEHVKLPSQSEVLAQLTPGGNASFVADHIRDLAVAGANAILIISHLPLVGYLVSELCPHKEPPMFTTSTIACVELDLAHQKSDVVWMLSPSQLSAK
ncbi:phosphohistidine phosphatase SixA [Providencia rettgeri]|uniref:phosphohistidine phosphatase SixA n=1 Tax=Providencia rettgeri TaxID=587 RepID=UPI0034E0B734